MIHRHVWLTSTALGARGGAGGIPPCPEKHVAAAPPAPTLGSRCRCFPSPPSARSPAYRCKVTSARERGRLKSFPRGKEKKSGGALLQPHRCTVRKAAPLGRERGCVNRPKYRSTRAGITARGNLEEGTLRPAGVTQRAGRGPQARPHSSGSRGQHLASPHPCPIPWSLGAPAGLGDHTGGRGCLNQQK